MKNALSTIAIALIGLAPIGVYAADIPIDPTATYLLTDTVDDFNAQPTVPIALAPGIAPGDLIFLRVFGSYDDGGGTMVRTDLAAVFSSSSTLLAATMLNRIPDAIEAGGNFVTPATFLNEIPTDIPEDFVITDFGAQSGDGIEIGVPVGATHLFVGPPDSFMGDNVSDEFRLQIEIISKHIDIDIKPGSDPNSINLCSHGAVPVAIFSEPNFDATQIDPTTLRLADADVKMVGKSDNVLCHDEYVDDDAVLDKVCQFVTMDLALDGDLDTTATLLGNLLDGRAFNGTDAVNIVKDCQ